MEGLAMDKRFWNGKRVLITGHTGFKGSWLSLWLQSKGANVIGYSLPPPTVPSLFELADVIAGMQSITGDVRDLKSLEKVIARQKPDIIIHMAAQSLVRYSYVDPVETYSTNIMGTVNILEAAKNSDFVKVIVIVTSDKCYENKELKRGYRENDRMGGYDPYSSSKGCAELITSAYITSYFSKSHSSNHTASVASVRAGNVIGGGDWTTDGLIPDTMNAFMHRLPVIIRYPNAIRPWQYVLEPLRGYLMLIEALWDDGSKYSGPWNFGPKNEDNKKVSWIVKTLTKLWGKGARMELDTARHLHEASCLKLDSSKARDHLGWSSKLNISRTLEWIVNWYLSYQNKEDMRRITEAEIKRFEGL